MAAIAGMLAAGCASTDATHGAGETAALVASGEVTVLARSEHIPTYPCSRCHDSDFAPNRQRRKLELHSRIELRHMPAERWCYGCHSVERIDQLRLPSGKHIAFDDASELCGACHGEKHRDWKANIHGLTTGYWNGPKTRRACTGCHSPHAPRVESMTPRPPPDRPRTVSAVTPHGAKRKP